MKTKMLKKLSMVAAVLSLYGPAAQTCAAATQAELAQMMKNAITLPAKIGKKECSPRSVNALEHVLMACDINKKSEFSLIWGQDIRPKKLPLKLKNRTAVYADLGDDDTLYGNLVKIKKGVSYPINGFVYKHGKTTMLPGIYSSVSTDGRYIELSNDDGSTKTYLHDLKPITVNTSSVPAGATVRMNRINNSGAISIVVEASHPNQSYGASYGGYLANGKLKLFYSPGRPEASAIYEFKGTNTGAACFVYDSGKPDIQPGYSTVEYVAFVSAAGKISPISLGDPYQQVQCEMINDQGVVFGYASRSNQTGDDVGIFVHTPLSGTRTMEQAFPGLGVQTFVTLNNQNMAILSVTVPDGHGGFDSVDRLVQLPADF